jgi:hypothetical protein
MLTLAVLMLAEVMGVPALAARNATEQPWLRQRVEGMTPVTGLYRNREYGFEVSIPKGLTGWTGTAPAPDHGVLIVLGPHRTIEVYATYDAMGYGSTKVLLDNTVPVDKPVHVERNRVRLGGLPAERATLTRTGGGRAIIVAQRRGGAGQAVNCTVWLETTHQNAAQDQKIFERILAGYRHLGR